MINVEYIREVQHKAFNAFMHLLEEHPIVRSHATCSTAIIKALRVLQVLCLRAEQMDEVLRSVEWILDEDIGSYYCPVCNQWKEDGHRESCKLAAVLNEPEIE